MVPQKYFFSRKFNVTQLNSILRLPSYVWRMPEIQDCNVTVCESFAKVPRGLRKSWGWDLKGGALSFSRLPHFHTYSLTLSIFHLTLSLSLSLSLPHYLSLSLTLAVCLSLSLSLSRESFAKVFFSCEVGHFGNKEFRTTPI